ncbi:LPXTG cell wall anchor domain-containing protein [Kitasatospora sp. NPDC050543]|uniref:LPXTG cell wall anchor domain-containing protein n=1 Tax=Kitasatospora sp. NPDC050543 TaxID=3364054 RepID=UPI0037970553
MRAPVISAFTKNVPSLSRRSAVTAGVAALVISAGLPLLPGAGAAWACGDDRFSSPRTTDGAEERGEIVHPAGEFKPFSFDTIAADGKWVEVGLSMTNTSSTDQSMAHPTFGLMASKGAAIRAKDVTVEVMQNGTWKRLGTTPGCGPTIDAETNVLAQPLPHDRAANFMFRIALSPDSPQSQSELMLVTDAWGTTARYAGRSDLHTLKITHPKAAPAAAKPTATATAKPSAAPAKPATQAKPAAPVAAAKPVAEQSPAPAVTATPAATTPAAPTAAAPTPTAAAAATAELAQTGSNGSNGLLAGAAAAVLALGAAALFAVRRLRNQA